MPFARLDRATTPTARIGLGLAAVGRPGYITPHRDRDLPADRGVDALRERTHELLDAAYAQGVRYVDAARSYGRSEEFLAGWLAAHPEADDVVVGSKWGYTYTGDWNTDAETHEVKDHSLAAFERQRAESAELLGDRLDLYQIHSVTADSPALTDTALHERLARLAEQGVTVGFSTSGPAQADAIRAALAVTVDGTPLFRTVQATYNALETSAGQALAEAHDAGLTILVKEAVANGRLAGTEAPAVVREIAADEGLEADAVALALVLREPWAGVVLSGAATVTQLAANLHAPLLDLDPERLDRLSALVEEPEAYWRYRSSLPWT
ncbi:MULTISPECIES: aldo/keto reductase [unclassified Streptomyces]|uniref:aldo/keto reductase n=1 Tax=unclassified Streptomyces TaxID=2593676 RepID=UPI0001C1B12B|nr:MULTISPECIES: aldo/keto reductase [unclassified Streptomyces]AEN08904.1 aldo/keto reductase [Streptomyces sp. SirexAA-E]MYR69099.1 aldo/keto reductase [Streptomyces sp. SID4939]MYS03032.1 aldo/keto reductase [Streptomyces sp. SID4940]MYT64009.1 aldo/keto reductase [Streptomyces sp. SID8357]MYT89259.1 aldo/keto reductase [Streptomyces sp. SID8360]